MTYDLRIDSSWETQNKILKEKLQIEHPQVQIGAYYGVGHALIDIFYGVKEFWPIRKHVIVIVDGSPYLIPALRTFTRDNFVVDRISSQNNDITKEIVEKIKADTLAIIYCSDHIFTGEVWTNSELSKISLQKKIPLIEVNNYSHYYFKQSEYNPFLLSINNYQPDLAIVVAGHRVKYHQHSAALMEWSVINTKMNSILNSPKQNQELVVHFEEQVRTNLTLKSKKISLFFDSKNLNRLWDRSIVNLDSIGGDYFINELAKKLGIDLNQPGYEARLETSHLCRWNTLDNFDWWGYKINNSDELKSLISISAEILGDPHFFKEFVEMINSCQT